MLDTGQRGTELCSLTINDVNLKIRKVTIRHGVTGGAERRLIASRGKPVWNCTVLSFLFVGQIR